MFGRATSAYLEGGQPPTRQGSGPCAYRLPKTGNTIITYGGIATSDGIPTNRNLEAFCTSRIIEVTPRKEVAFDLRIEGTSKDNPVPLSSFRADFLPGAQICPYCFGGFVLVTWREDGGSQDRCPRLYCRRSRSSRLLSCSRLHSVGHQEFCKVHGGLPQLRELDA